MNAVAILAVVSKGIALAQTLIEAGQSAAPAIKALAELLSGGQAEVTEEQLNETEKTLDALLAEFNAPLPEQDPPADPPPGGGQ